MSSGEYCSATDMMAASVMFLLTENDCVIAVVTYSQKLFGSTPATSTARRHCPRHTRHVTEIIYKKLCCCREAARLCLSVVSFNSTTLRAQSLSPVTSASDLTMRSLQVNYDMFSSAYQSTDKNDVDTRCHKHNSTIKVVGNYRLKFTSVSNFSLLLTLLLTLWRHLWRHRKSPLLSLLPLRHRGP